MSGHLLTAVTACALCASAHTALAQRVLRGTVRDSAASAALPGVVLSVIDSAGQQTARTIADGFGRFALALPPHAARLRAIRIGYQPREFPLGRNSGEAPLELVMVRIPPILSAVRISDRELCPGSADQGPAFQYWEQARAGLLAEVVAREANPAVARTLVYERRTTLSDDVVHRQQVQQHLGRTTRPFVASAAPRRFAERGYMLTAGGDRLFSAPDADVLLDESFAATHCFHLQNADARHLGQIGLAFNPVPGRPDSLVDVSGVIWLDRDTPVLRSLDFRYTSLEPAAMRAGAGGHLEFRTAENGLSFIEWWSMRLPILALPPNRSLRDYNAPRSATRSDRDDLVVDEIQEAGGQVLQARWPDSTEWHDQPSGISGTVMQRGGVRPIPHAIVTIRGTSDTTESDERGEFSFTPMVPGRYTLVVTDTTMFGFAAPRAHSRVVDVRRNGVARVSEELPGVLEIVGRLCDGTAIHQYLTTVTGRVTLSDGVVPRNAKLEATWQAGYAGYLGVSVTIQTTHRSIELDNDGRFVVCRVAAGRPLKLRLIQGAAFADTTVVPPEDRLMSVEWKLPTLRQP